MHARALDDSVDDLLLRPHRYLLMRRLARARALVGAGAPLAEIAAAAGFAAQAHFTRHFKKAYGLPPGRWAALTAA